MQESLPPEHGGEGRPNALEELLDGGGVTDEGGGHLQATRRNIAHRRLNIVGDPLHEVAAVLVLNAQQLFVHLLHGHPATKDGGDGEVAPVLRIAGRHHVLGVEQLGGQLGYCQ